MVASLRFLSGARLSCDHTLVLLGSPGANALPLGRIGSVWVNPSFHDLLFHDHNPRLTRLDGTIAVGLKYLLAPMP